MLNFAILSAGNIAGRMARTLDSLRDEVQPYAIAARDSARAQALAGRYGFAKSFAGYEALLVDPAVDVVYIGSIHPLHAQHIRAALLAGKHVLCEKPLTLNAAQAQSLFALARERGLLLAEAMWTAKAGCRYDQQVKLLGCCGKLRVISCRCLNQHIKCAFRLYTLKAHILHRLI